MDTLQSLLAVVLLAILAEVTYLVVKLPRQARRSGQTILVDTSVLIDGRIVAVAKSGFISGSLVIPRSVIGELQFLADNADHEKRGRARYGLDVVTELQNIPQVVVEILQDGSKAEEGVDERLLKLAKKMGASVCTIDYNLNKVAVVEGITVVNVNELAQSLRMARLPGEKMMLDIVQKGQDQHQGVGYLADGTMVVVERASQSIGKSIEVEFIRSLQTAAGKMMFARPTDHKDQQPHNNKPEGKKPVAKPVKQDQPAQQVQKTKKQPQPSRPQNAQHNQKDHHEQQPRQSDQHTQQQSQQAQKQQQRTNKSRNKQPRSKDREAALIDLVDKQQ